MVAWKWKDAHIMDLNKAHGHLTRKLGRHFTEDFMKAKFGPEDFVNAYNLIMDAYNIGFGEGYDAAERDHR